MAHRQLTLSTRLFRLLGPWDTCALMKLNGFRFDAEGCPSVMTQPAMTHTNGENGEVTHHQWDTLEERDEWLARRGAERTPAEIRDAALEEACEACAGVYIDGNEDYIEAIRALKDRP